MWEQRHFIKQLSLVLCVYARTRTCFLRQMYLSACDAKVVVCASADLVGRQCHQQHCRQVCMRTDVREIT